MKNSTVIIGVIGASECGEDMLGVAREVGREIGRRKAVLICGGLGGVMEAACEGARLEGGLTIGILPGTHREEANPYLDLPIVTGLNDARNVIIARTAHVLIAIGGRHGTLSEIAFAMKFGVPVVGVKTWDVIPGAFRASGPGEAVEKAWSLIKM